MLSAVLLAGGVLVFSPGAINKRMAQECFARLQARPQNATQLTGQLTQLGHAGVPYLIQAWDSPHADVRVAARQAIERQWAAWRKLERTRRQEALWIFATQLRQLSPDMGTAAQVTCRRYAIEILGLPSDATNRRQAELILACQDVLQVTSQAYQRTLEQQRAIALGGPDQSVPTNASTTRTDYAPMEVGQVTGALRPPRLLELPGVEDGRSFPAGQPAPMREIDPVPGVTEPNGSALPSAEPQSQTEPPRLDRPRQPEVPEVLLPVGADPLAEIVPGERRARRGSDANSSEFPLDGESGEFNKSKPLKDRLEQFSDRELASLLVSADANTAELAQRFLTQRGWSPRDIQLGKHVFDPDPLNRLQLVLELPEFARDASLWLHWLSYDRDSRVRLQAAKVMATSQNQFLHARLREMSREDSDDQVRFELRRWRNHVSTQVRSPRQRR